MELCAKLVRDHGLTKEQILELDEFWLYHIYFHPINPKTEDIWVRAKTKKATMTPEQVWRRERRKLGWPDWYTEEEWQRHLELAATKKADKNGAKSNSRGRGKAERRPERAKGPG